jgi:allantoate deiminase
VLTRAEIAAKADEVIARCRKLASFSEDSGSTRRTFLSAPMRDCHRELGSWMSRTGMKVSVDAAGNLRGFYSGSAPEAPRLVLGSHLDTVPNAGAYDGILGVVAAITLIEALGAQKLPFAVEVLGFSEEEGVRFGVPFIGSRALVGRLDGEVLDRRDAQGISVREAIRQFGLDDNKIPQAALPDDVLGYVEFHIEQGPQLEDLGQPLAVVEAIAGQSRLELTFTGCANHAGTTPMNLRRDALVAAAEWIVAVENAALAVGGLVATVGMISVKPGATNAIAGETRVSLDVRHAVDEVRGAAVQNLTRQAEEIVKRRGLSVLAKQSLDQPAVAMDDFLTQQIARAMRASGCAAHRLVSGAGHDAMILAERVPAAMIFLRTPGGVSHHPSETVLAEDVAKALACGEQLLQQLAASSEFLKRTCRA